MVFGSTPHSLTRSEWEARRAAHVERVSAWADDRVSRASRDVPNPVYDFLFEYYPFRPSHLKRWSPGIGVTLEGASADELDWAEHFTLGDSVAVIDPLSFPERRRPFLEWAFKYLTGIANRPPQFSCFGLHEWAMVYRSDAPRHTSVPLRLPAEEINAIVERSDLRCTHFDAFRFFTPDAVPLNKNHLSREATTDFDQRACIHVTMDLYRFAHKIAPWCSSELIADTFLLAADARRIDMRASPYDLSSFGYTAVPIETPEGRAEYERYQRIFAERARPLRERLMDLCRALLAEND